MTPDQLKQVKEVVADAIQVNVNGKIDELRKGQEAQHRILERQNEVMDALQTKIEIHNEKHEGDMSAIRPIIEGIAGTKIVGRVFLWMAAIAVAWSAIKGFRL